MLKVKKTNTVVFTLTKYQCEGMGRHDFFHHSDVVSYGITLFFPDFYEKCTETLMLTDSIEMLQMSFYALHKKRKKESNFYTISYV